MSPTLLGESRAIERLRERLSQIAATPLPVLLLGETGTGKEVAARYVHARSGRDGEFVAVDCGALSPTLVETELFGHERGAFTGAAQRREGLVRAAEGGTFFLDEIGELPLDSQTRLLRILQEGTYRLVGGTEERRADIRVVAATCRPLDEWIAAGRFRRDLYHRLAVVEVGLPPLRDRAEDIPLLFEHFIAHGTPSGHLPPRPSTRLVEHLTTWPWPGNVRELRNVAAYVAATCRAKTADIDDLPPQMRGAAPMCAARIAPVRIDLPYMEARRVWLDAFQQQYVEAILDAHEGNVSAAARAAGMDRRSIQRIAARRRQLAAPSRDLGKV